MLTQGKVTNRSGAPLAGSFRMAAMDWTGFSTTPEQINTIIKTWKSRTNATLLNTGESFTDWTGGNFLAATKYANPFKRSTSTTFKNLWTGTTLNTTNVQRLIADISKARKLGWKPEYAISRGLEELVDWYRNYRSEEWTKPR